MIFILMEWWPLRDIWSQNQRVSRKTYSENSQNSCHYTVCWHILCWCVILLHVNISSVCWHGMADTSCVRKVPKPFWPTSWNSGQWGHWSWYLSIWQHRRWSLLHRTLCELLYFCSGVPVYILHNGSKLFYQITGIILGQDFALPDFISR